MLHAGGAVGVRRASEVTYEQVVAKLGSVQLVDVRRRDEVAAGALPTALNIPVEELQDALTQSGKDFEAKYGFSKPNPALPLCVYCRSGVRSTLGMLAPKQMQSIT